MTKPDKTSLDLHGHKNLVDFLLTALDDAKDAKKRAESARNTLDTVVLSLREHQERQGVFLGSIVARGTNKSGTFTFANRFSSDSTKVVEGLKADVGDTTYEELFATATTAKLKDSGRVKELRTLLGDKFDEFFAVEVTVKPVKDFNERKFNLVQSGANQAALNKVSRQFSHKPQFKVK